MIDLHMHSTFSDGTWSPKEIVDEAKRLGLKQIAITDHNILDGSIEGSKLSEVNFIISTELSVGYKGKEVHLLGYFPNGSNYKNTQFVINEGETYKRIAIMEMIENLNKEGIDLDLLELNKYAKGIINRVHICMALKDHGYISSISEGFEKYVGEDCPAYVERKTVTIEEAADAIHNDGGITVIAHPYEYYDTDEEIETFLIDIMKEIDGVECFHPSATSTNSKFLVSIAEENNKLITGGSDFHGDNKPDICIDMMNVDEKYKIERK